MRARNITGTEWRWVLIVSLAVLLFASLPTLYAWSLADADHVFTGFVYNTQDGNSYLAKMRLGARGEWLFYIFYTPEPHQPALVFPFHLLLGRMGAALGLPLVLVYHLARVLFGLGLLLTVYAFVSHFVDRVVTRRLAWGLVAVGSGLGWLLAVLGQTRLLGDLPLDFWVPEAYAFLVLYNLPHLALAESLLLGALLQVVICCEGTAAGGFFGGRAGRVALAGLATLAMTWIVPFYAGVLAAALAAYLLILWIQRRRPPWRETGLMALVGLFALPSLAYNGWLFAFAPVYSDWARQNRLASPHPLHYLLGYALLLIPALWAVWRAVAGGRADAADRIEVATPRPARPDVLLLAAWAVLSIGIAYAPLVTQRRLIVLAQVPLATLAAVGFMGWLADRQAAAGRQEGKTSRAAFWAAAVYVLLASLSNVLLVAGSLGPIARRESPVYRPGAEVRALEWLAAQAEAGETALASFEVGNVIPVWTDLRVFAGHGPETLCSGDKGEMLEQFFQAGTSDAWRQALLRDFGVDYVFYGPREQALGRWDPGSAPYLAAIYEAGDYAVYRVLGPEAP